jgi:hypothetical protein
LSLLPISGWVNRSLISWLSFCAVRFLCFFAYVLMTSVTSTYGMRKSLCKVRFDMYQGALANFLNVLDWNVWTRNVSLRSTVAFAQSEMFLRGTERSQIGPVQCNLHNFWLKLLQICCADSCFIHLLYSHIVKLIPLRSFNVCVMDELTCESDSAVDLSKCYALHCQFK